MIDRWALLQTFQRPPDAYQYSTKPKELIADYEELSATLFSQVKTSSHQQPRDQQQQ